MRRLSILAILLAALPLIGQAQPPLVAPNIQYKIDFDPGRDVAKYDPIKDKDSPYNEKKDADPSKLYIKARFTITAEGSAMDDPNSQYKIVIEENGHKVYEDDVPRPTPTEDLSVVLALDNSGSMKEHGRIEKARTAADFFLKKLPQKADCGLILFDHEIIKELEPVGDRAPLLKAVSEMKPRGGTAFLDAGARGIELLSQAPSHKQRFLVLMTDGVDLNSNATLNGVIQQALKANVRIITIGIGEPGKQEPVNTVLVLDQSGSMKAPADNNEKTAKIEGLHRAASRFAAIMPTTGWASIIPFSTLVGQPSEFTNDRSSLIRRMKSLRPEGETALLDATYAGICTLDASGRKGKRAVIAMTDGIDNASRRRIGEVVTRAKEAKIPVYTLGFGREGELDTKLLSKLASETGGKYYHARNEKSLLEIFENLSIQLHDDGIDEISLKEMARATGGMYYPVKNIGELQLILNKVNQSIQEKEYKVRFPSTIQKAEGTRRQVSIKLVHRTGRVVSNEATGPYFVPDSENVVQANTQGGVQMRGLVAAEMHPLVYLLLLIGVGFMLLLPSMLRFPTG